MDSMNTDRPACAGHRRSLYQTAWLVGLLILTLGPMLPAQAQVRSRTVTVSPRNRTVTRDTTTVRGGVRRDSTTTVRGGIRTGVTTTNRVGERRDTTTTVRTSRFSAAAAEVVRLTNEERAAAGCQPLVVHDSLAAAATAHSEDMAAHRELSHTGSDGRSAPERALGAGYAYRMIAENVAVGQWGAVEVVRAWMNSPVHRTNILNCELREIGIGAARSPDDPSRETYWTQLFGIPR